MVPEGMEFRPGYVPRCKPPIEAENVRWANIGACGVDRDDGSGGNPLVGLGFARVCSVLAVLLLLLVSLFVTWLLRNVPVVLGLWVVWTNRQAPAAMRRLTEAEMHVDQAAHDAWWVVRA